MPKLTPRAYAFQVEALHVLCIPGRGENDVDPGGTARDDQPRLGLSGMDGGVDDHVRAGGVHECQLAHVEHDQIRAGLGFA
jgi:hypothetical protein